MTWRFLALILPILCGCGALAPSVRFAAIGDLSTTNPRSMAESGHGRPIEMPAGVSWVLTLDGYAESTLDAQPSRRFEFGITISDMNTGSGRGSTQSVRPELEGAELSDDSGQRFACHRARVPATGTNARRGEATPSVAHYTLIFDLPSTYRFQQIAHATVHWQLMTARGDVTQVSSRFRR